jgi:hypothetical protein
MFKEAGKIYFNKQGENKPPVFELDEADKPYLDENIIKLSEEQATEYIKQMKNPDWDKLTYLRHKIMSGLIKEKKHKLLIERIESELDSKRESIVVQKIEPHQLIADFADKSFFDKKIILEKMADLGLADAEFLITIIKEDKDKLSKLAAIEAVKLLDGEEAEKALDFIVSFYSQKIMDDVAFDDSFNDDDKLDARLSKDESFYIYSNYPTNEESTEFYHRLTSACIRVFDHFGRRAQPQIFRAFFEREEVTRKMNEEIRKIHREEGTLIEESTNDQDRDAPIYYDDFYKNEDELLDSD